MLTVSVNVSDNEKKVVNGSLKYIFFRFLTAYFSAMCKWTFLKSWEFFPRWREYKKLHEILRTNRNYQSLNSHGKRSFCVSVLLFIFAGFTRIFIERNRRRSYFGTLKGFRRRLLGHLSHCEASWENKDVFLTLQDQVFCKRWRGNINTI